ncbi:hypothetical protein TVNIR_1426 [Thioalkalivibrio nitratireducens DSM 14787]|uniref:Uncharacterized protein n=1 Tax=Thioalkalivibrio nitratireducens (strain DSM 14787 / UNIQEM 213 / ALEN2) TaxID=1255043 RepID=L0DVN7_THIND|nr:hypothetical protein TVNIR_1426 [Thioalkalivibrio nitratireducens DSM 14787]
MVVTQVQTPGGTHARQYTPVRSLIAHENALCDGITTEY